MLKCYDVIILGGGPSGLATAVALRRLGRSVAVVERSDYK
ncbi:MAG: FAD-dependent oxidoreductase, partial [Anderseniella sp.]